VPAPGRGKVGSQRNSVGGIPAPASAASSKKVGGATLKVAKDHLQITHKSSDINISSAAAN